MQDYKFEVGDTFEIYFPEDDEPQWYKVEVTVRGEYWVELSFEEGEVFKYDIYLFKYYKTKNYKSKTDMKNWAKITEPSDIKKYPVGTPVRVNGVETVIVKAYYEPNRCFNVKDCFIDSDGNQSSVFALFDWSDGVVEVLIETPVPDIPTPDTPVEQDMVKNPNHYQLLPEHGLEVKDVLKAVLNKIEQSDFDMNLYEAGWYQQSMQYFLRFCDKNGVQDLEKGVQTMRFVLESIKERTQEESE